MLKKLSLLVMVSGVTVAWWYRRNSTSSGPVVVLDYGSFRGKFSHKHGIEQFFGIPYAEPPVGDRRFTNPIPPLRTYWNHDSTKHPAVCPQQSLGGNTSSIYKDWFDNLGLNPLMYLKPFGSGQEDCLTIDITRPTGLTNSSKLPVIYFIYPGGYNYGASWELTGVPMVKKSIEMNLPIIWVSGNHRTNAFGFLGGKEVGQAGVGNLGLKDQRLTMEWIQKHIAEFGGDPQKVIVYGESSGAISISHHLFAFHGNLNGLFRGAICQSGTALPVGKFSDGAGQKGFDLLVDRLGCQTSKDKLDCLRHADLRKMQDVIDELPGTFSFGSFPLTFGPAVDGEFVTESIQHALAGGRFAKVPVIICDVQDEGTILALGAHSVKTEDQFREFISKKVPKASPDQIEKVLQLWPSDPKLGSPFGSGDKNAITPVYKQYSAILGDFGFQGLRRLFLRATCDFMPTWSLLDRAEQHFPVVGAFHASDIPAVIGIIPGKRSEDYQARWISFAYNLDPNVNGLPKWEKYNDRHSLVMDKDGSIGMEPDTFREKEIDYYLEHIEDFVFASP